MPKKRQDAEHLVSSIGALVRRLRSERMDQQLSWTEGLVMGRLARGGPASIADLARAEGIKPQSMGATIAALDKNGIVARKPHPTDGRQSLVELTRKGAALRERIKSAKQAWLDDAIAKLPREERDILFAAGDIIARLAES